MQDVENCISSSHNNVLPFSAEIVHHNDVIKFSYGVLEIWNLQLPKGCIDMPYEALLFRVILWKCGNIMGHGVKA